MTNLWWLTFEISTFLVSVIPYKAKGILPVLQQIENVSESVYELYYC